MLIRVICFYAFFFFVALIIGGFFLQFLGDGLFALFTFGAPAVMVWWNEKRRSAHILSASDSGTEYPRVQETKNSIIAARSTPTHTTSWEKQHPSTILSTSSSRAAGNNVTGKSSRHQGWVPEGALVSILGHEIRGMVYVGTPPSLNTYGYGEKCRAYIDPSLPISRMGTDKAGNGMPYWPGYSSIPPECRATYLSWLASGAADNSYNPGYMFLYFYGLERRFFVDDPAIEEKKSILAEVRRLARLYAENRSAERYLSEFIEFAIASVANVETLQPVFENPGWDLPFSVKLAIGAKLEKAERLNADWVLSWFLCHPERHLRTAGKRCRDEFMALFRLHFEQKFPEGLKVNKPRRLLKASYHAASREFVRTVSPELDENPIPDISGLRKPIKIAQEIADKAMDDLEKFSRYLGRNPEGRGSIEAHALLPAALRSSFPSEQLDAVKAWAATIVQKGGLVPIRDVLKHLEGGSPEKLGKRQLTGAADALARLGFGLAPDPRFALRSPKIDEPVVLFALDDAVEQMENVSNTYKAALVQLALASFVAHADGDVSELERKALETQAQSVDGLTGQEQKRLMANLTWFLAVPPNMPLLRRKLSDNAKEQSAVIRAALVSAAHADGVVKPEEITNIEKIYRTLGLDPSLVYSDLHSGEVSDTPIRVRAASPSAPGEAIPAEAAPASQGLDSDRIARIRKDTERASAVLADIFITDTDHDQVARAKTTSILDGLDDKHTDLVRRIISRSHWNEEEFSELVSSHGLMTAGALETVNEWAFVTYDEPLLDEYDGYDVSSDITEALADKFE